MRYNRETHEIELQVGEQCCGSGLTPAVDENSDLFAFMPQDADVRSLAIKYKHCNITYAVSGRAYLRGDRLCEMALMTADGSIPAIAGESVLLAFMLSSLSGKSDITIETFSADTAAGIVTSTCRIKKYASLEAAFVKFAERNSGIAAMLAERGETVLPLAADIKFPYTGMRRGQRLMMNECYGAMRDGARLFIQAPTGIGKTISALYPAVRYLGTGKCDKIFYLTAKSSTQREAYRAAGLLFDAGAQLRTVIISAKEQVCLCREHMTSGMCDARSCPFSVSPEYIQLQAVSELMTRRNGYDQKCIMSAALKYKICPHELSLTLAQFCEIIIADYNYVFDPLVRLKRFFETPNTGKYVFLIDEAHNLADRAREMFSAELCNTDFILLQRQTADILPELNDEINAALSELGRLRELCGDDMIKDEHGKEHGFYVGRQRPEAFDEVLDKLCLSLMRRLRRGAGEPAYKRMSSLYRAVRKYLITGIYSGDSSLLYCEADGERTTAKVICLDPSSQLNSRMDSADSTVLFSATLTPLDYFIDILGGGRQARSLALPSPFERDNLFIAAVDDISTRFEDREKTLPRTVSYIAAAVSCKKGNYIVYFPSYEYMKNAAELFAKKYPGVRLLVQRRGMTRSDKEKYLDEFRLADGRMRVGFCVLGGSFSEGIDLPGSSLIGVVIVGVGVPGLSGERNIMRDYFELTRESGYDYAYTYPGMNNIMQAAGRVIRSDTDCGIVVLIDDRYATPKYMAMYPEHWSLMNHFSQPASLNGAVDAFWKQKSSKNADN